MRGLRSMSRPIHFRPTKALTKRPRVNCHLNNEFSVYFHHNNYGHTARGFKFAFVDPGIRLYFAGSAPPLLTLSGDVHSTAYNGHLLCKKVIAQAPLGLKGTIPSWQLLVAVMELFTSSRVAPTLRDHRVIKTIISASQLFACKYSPLSICASTDRCSGSHRNV